MRESFPNGLFLGSYGGNTRNLTSMSSGSRDGQAKWEVEESLLRWRLHGGEGFCLISKKLCGCCTNLGMLSVQGKRIPCRQHNAGEELRFPARFLVIEHEAMQQVTLSQCRNFLPDSPKPFQRSPSYFPDSGTKHDAHDNGVCSVHNISRSKSQPQPAYYFAECGEL